MSEESFMSEMESLKDVDATPSPQELIHKLGRILQQLFRRQIQQLL